jgi:hypothetical protein
LVSALKPLKQYIRSIFIIGSFWYDNTWKMSGKTVLEQPDDISGIRTMRLEMIIYLDNRFAHFALDKVFDIATVLDPTCNLQLFVNVEVYTIKHMLLTEALGFIL